MCHHGQCWSWGTAHTTRLYDCHQVSQMAVVNPCALRTLDGSPVSIFHVGSAKSSKAVHDDHLQGWGRDDAVCAAELGRIWQHAGEILFISFLTAPNFLNLNLLCLVVWNIFLFFHRLGMSSSQLTHIFQRGSYTTNQCWYVGCVRKFFGARFRSQVEHLHCRVRGYLAHAADPSDWAPGRRMESWSRSRPLVSRSV